MSGDLDDPLYGAGDVIHLLSAADGEYDDSLEGVVIVLDEVSDEAKGTFLLVVTPVDDDGKELPDQAERFTVTVARAD